MRYINGFLLNYMRPLCNNPSALKVSYVLNLRLEIRRINIYFDSFLQIDPNDHSSSKACLEIWLHSLGSTRSNE